MGQFLSSMVAPSTPFSGPEIPFLDDGSPVVSGKWEVQEEKVFWVWTYASGSQQSSNALDVAIDSSLHMGERDMVLSLAEKKMVALYGHLQLPYEISTLKRQLASWWSLNNDVLYLHKMDQTIEMALSVQLL